MPLSLKGEHLLLLGIFPIASTSGLLHPWILRLNPMQKERGLISNIDFIDAKLNLQNAELSDINNQYDFISAMVELYYLLGKLDSIVSIES